MFCVFVALLCLWVWAFTATVGHDLICPPIALTMSSLWARPSAGMELKTRASWLPCSAISVPSPVNSQCLEERSSAEITCTEETHLSRHCVGNDRGLLYSRYHSAESSLSLSALTDSSRLFKLDVPVASVVLNEHCSRWQRDFRRHSVQETHVADGLQTLHGSDDDLVVQPEAVGHFHAVHAIVRLLNPL